MKFNKWTLGLAIVGAVSMASTVRADEAKMSQLNTALSNTMSGFVKNSAQMDIGKPYSYHADSSGSVPAIKSFPRIFSREYSLSGIIRSSVNNQLAD